MFTWICPQCGREVPPAYNECPDCAGKTAGGAPPPAATAGSPAGTAAPLQPLPNAAQPPAYAPPQQTAAPMFQPTPPPQPQRYAPQPPGGIRLPTWLLAILFAVVLVGAGGGAILFFSHSRTPTPTAVIETPASKENPVQKYIEISGVRFASSSKGVLVSFVVINHSDSDLVGLAGNVKVFGLTQKAEEDPVGTFVFQTSMAAQTSKELQMPFTTKLKFMELPDWQNVKVIVQVTAPQGA
jgi:hypothetical protein